MMTQHFSHPPLSSAYGYLPPPSAYHPQYHPPSSSTIDGQTILYLLIAALVIYLAYQIYQVGLCGFVGKIPGVGTAAKLVCSGAGAVDDLLGGAGGLISGLASGDVGGVVGGLLGGLGPASGVVEGLVPGSGNVLNGMKDLATNPVAAIINPGSMNFGSSHNDQGCREFDSGHGNMKRVAIDGVCQFGEPGHKCFDNNDCIAFHNGQEDNKRVCWDHDFCTDGVWGKKQGTTRLHAPCQGSHDCRDGFYCESGSCASNEDCNSFQEMPWCKDLAEWNTFSGCCALQNEANCGGGRHRPEKSKEFGSTICGGTG